MMPTKVIEQKYSMREPEQDQEPIAQVSELIIKIAVDGRGRNVYQFDDLARSNSQVVVVVLSGAEYELRRTKAGRLVLNK
jgi:hemin uptake protein HemP